MSSSPIINQAFAVLVPFPVGFLVAVAGTSAAFVICGPIAIAISNPDRGCDLDCEHALNNAAWFVLSTLGVWLGTFVGYLSSRRR